MASRDIFIVFNHYSMYDHDETKKGYTEYFLPIYLNSFFSLVQNCVLTSILLSVDEKLDQQKTALNLSYPTISKFLIMKTCSFYFTCVKVNQTSLGLRLLARNHRLSEWITLGKCNRPFYIKKMIYQFIANYPSPIMTIISRWCLGVKMKTHPDWSVCVYKHREGRKRMWRLSAKWMWYFSQPLHSAALWGHRSGAFTSNLTVWVKTGQNIPVIH